MPSGGGGSVLWLVLACCWALRTVYASSPPGGGSVAADAGRRSGDAFSWLPEHREGDELHVPAQRPAPRVTTRRDATLSSSSAASWGFLEAPPPALSASALLSSTTTAMAGLASLEEHQPVMSCASADQPVEHGAGRVASAQDGYPALRTIKLERLAGISKYGFSYAYYNYALNLTLGSPKQQSLRFVLQTLSSPLLVLESHNCPSYARSACFNSSLSETFALCQVGRSRLCPQYYRYCNLYTDIATFTLGSDLSQKKALLCMAIYSQSTYDLPERVSGSLGLGYLYSEGAAPITSFFPPSWPHIISLDLNGKDSQIYFGGYELADGRDVAPIQWGERQTHGILYHWFPVHSMKICGVNLLNEGVTMAVISLESPCLGLPHALYVRILKWLDVQKADCGRGGQPCYFNHIEKELIPNMYITLSYHGEPIHLNLSNLLLPPISGKQEFCIEDLSVSISQPLRVLGQPIIYFGSMVLEQLLVVLDYDERRVGIANKLPYHPVEWCPPHAQCRHGQTLDLAGNICEDPTCSDFWFQYTEPSTLKCRYELGFLIAVACVLSLLAAGELILSFAFQRLHAAVAATHPNITRGQLSRFFA